MNTLKISILSTLLALTSLGLGGCAADTGPEGDDDAAEMPAIETDTASPNYVARVTRKDIQEAGGKCLANGLCTLNGVWNCAGGGYCSRILQ